MTLVTPSTTKRNAFSLIELVVVVLIIGILAAVAAPRMFNTAGDARDNATRASLAVIRDAIELHKSENGSYPTAKDFAVTMKKYMKGTFPRVQASLVPKGNQNNEVASISSDPISPAGSQGWAYNETTGEFVINHSSCLDW